MKIGAKLVSVFLIISLVPVLILGAQGYLYTERQVTEETISKLDALASMQEDGINIVMKNNLERLIAFTTRVQLKIELDNFNNTGDTKSQAFISNLINTVKSQISSFREISVLNPEGVVVASTYEDEVGTNHASDEFFMKGKQSNDITIFFRDKDQNPSLYLTGPLVQDGKLVGVAVIASDLDSIYSITGTYAELSETGESYLVKRDKDGNALLITPLRFEPDAALNIRISKDKQDSPAIQALLGIEKTFLDATDYREKPVIATTRYIEESDMGLVVKIDKEEAFSLIDYLRYLMLISWTAGGSLIIGASLYLGKSISSPITRLRDKVIEISKGNFNVSISGIASSKAEDEIGELSFHFDEMRKRIKSMNENLQHLVQEKTKELEATNEVLRAKNDSLRELNNLLELQEKQLREADMAKEEFSTMITHELKTPLVPIVGYSELLMDGTLGEINPVQKEKVQHIYNSAISLSKLITDLLDVRKLELNKMRFDMVESPVKEIVEQSVSSFKPVSEAKKIDLVYNIVEEPGGQLEVSCDPKRIQQVLNNLLSNAVKFVPENTGRIEVSAKPADLSVVFAVRDNGIGIQREKQDHIFKKFYQADTSLRRETGGSGLGLAISKGIVEAHGGRIWFDSEPGSGSTFYFSIPMHSVNPEGGKK